MAVPEKREQIFPGDTLPIAYECRKPDVVDPIRQDRGLPTTPDSAFVRVKDQDDEWLEIGGVGLTTVPATITPQTGETAYDTGAIISYTLPSEFTQIPGNYTMFITAIFSGDIIRTEDKKFRVLEYR
jgi:hypothetical protein